VAGALALRHGRPRGKSRAGLQIAVVRKVADFKIVVALRAAGLRIVAVPKVADFKIAVALKPATSPAAGARKGAEAFKIAAVEVARSAMLSGEGLFPAPIAAAAAQTGQATGATRALAGAVAGAARVAVVAVLAGGRRDRVR
jgi:hypothetical protein